MLLKNCLFPSLQLSILIWTFWQVTAKRTNVPGMKQFRPRRPSNPYMGFRGRTPYAPPFAYAPAPYGYGYDVATSFLSNIYFFCDSVD